MTSQDCFRDAQKILVGGVNSPVRAFKSVGGTPIFMKSGFGATLLTEDGRRLLDYVLAWGPMILGHAHPMVTQAIQDAASQGTAFGAPTQAETQLALLIQELVPSMEKIRFVNSGTEATMSALRAARGFTKRNLVVKFNGCYHGHADSLLVAAGSGALTSGQPDSLGVPEEFVQHTAVLEYNDTQSITDLFHFKGDQIAAVIMEPVCGNMGVILPDMTFLKTIRQLCDRYHSLLIFDEVMTGFRVNLGGAQALFDVKPDLTCLGKVIGGGLPCGAYGGREDVMACVAPEGGVYQAGTMSGNPLVMAAGIATLTKLKQAGVFEDIERKTTVLVDGMGDILSALNLPYVVHQCGTMFSVFFCEGPVNNLSDTQRVNTRAFAAYHRRMLDQGIYLAPSAFESNFMSNAHHDRDLFLTLSSFEKCVSN